MRVQMDAQLSILYIEDNFEDASHLAKVIMNIFKEYDKRLDLNTEESVLKYLSTKGVDWIKNYDQFYNSLEQLSRLQQYKLFLVDMKMNGEGGVRGWEFIERIREKRGNQASPIWILSNYIFFARLAEKEYNIHHFFSKTSEGYDQLKDMLIEFFLPVRSTAQKDYLEFTNSRNSIVQIPVSQIVSIEIVNRHHYLYQLDPKGIIAHRRAFPPYKIFEIALKQICEKNISDLVQISHGVIINVKLVEHIQGSGKKYYLWLSQRGDSKPLNISYPYLKTVKNIYGDPLPLF